MKNKKIKVFAILLCLFLLTGCSKVLKDEKEVVKNPETGQALTENIICKPTEPSTIKLYEKYNDQLDIKMEELPNCEEFKITSNESTSLWQFLFVKPLAYLIIKLGNVVNNLGISLIIIGLLIRVI